MGGLGPFLQAILPNLDKCSIISPYLTTSVHYVHPPYMLQSVSLMDYDAEFAQLMEQRQGRLQRVNEVREAASESVRGLLSGPFYEQEGREMLIASG